MDIGSPELAINQNEIRQSIKPLQEKGIGVEIKEGKANAVFPEGTLPTPEQNVKITKYFNALSTEMVGVSVTSAAKIAEALEKYQNDPAYRKDMIMYGPSLEDDFAASRMKRLETARQEVTTAQMNTAPGMERVGAIKAATFARTHLPDLGLQTTINFLRAIR